MTIRHWTPDEDRRLATLVAQGLRDPEIATDLGRTPSAVVQRRCANGLKLLRDLKPTRPKRPRMPLSTIAAICDAIESGLTPTETSRRTGVSVGLVEYYSRREGAVSPSAKAGRDVRPIDADLVDLSSRGTTNSEIARRLGLTVSVVRGRLMTLARRDAVAEVRAGN